jgi:hypothetical protein
MATASYPDAAPHAAGWHATLRDAMAAEEVTRFLNHLAVAWKVSAPTQNQGRWCRKAPGGRLRRPQRIGRALGNAHAAALEVDSLESAHLCRWRLFGSYRHLGWSMLFFLRPTGRHNFIWVRGRSGGARH